MEPGPGTRAVRAGLPPAEQGRPFMPGPELAGPYHLQGDPHSTPYGYGRYGNRTVHAYEEAIGELEGGEAIVFASGMAACSAALLALLRSGDVLVAAADGYPVVRALAAGYLAEMGVETRLVATAADHGPALEGARLVWLETPSNPRLDVCDVRAIAAAAHDAGALVAVDNTLATPLGQRPLDLGADLSVASGTKALAGHSDIFIGYVAAADPALIEKVREWRSTTGGIPGPFETWLAHRSLATLDVRLERQCANAQAIAELLAARDDVVQVRFPGLPGDPAHGPAATQMRRFGMVVGFDLGSGERAQRFLLDAELVVEATSFGGIHTMAERRARWDHGDDVPAGFIRLSAGIEETADLVADIEHALDASRPG